MLVRFVLTFGGDWPHPALFGDFWGAFWRYCPLL